MLIRDSSTCPHHRVIDRSVLCELLHPSLNREYAALSCSVAHAIVPPGEATIPHRLRTATELYYVLSGCGQMHIGEESREIRAGQVVLIPPQAVQFIENCTDTDLVFLCIVSPPWTADDEELVAEETDPLPDNI